MTLAEYTNLPKGDPKEITIGARFRTKESEDKMLSSGALVFFYEVISINKHGFEFMERSERIEA